MKQILVDVLEDGEVRITTKGFSGPVCLDESQFLKDLLGQEIAVTLTPAYFAQNEENQKQFIPLCG